MKIFTLLLALVGFIGAARAADLLPIEQQVAEAIKAPGVTVVHFWAPWCPNCKAELANNGWATFIDTNAEANFIFVTAKHPEDGHEMLAKYGVGTQKNFQLLLHPNPARKKGEEMTSFMGIPMTWLPSTWIFRDGKLRYALNYGEVSFPMLQQLIRDSTEKWSHAKPAAAAATTPAAATAAPATTATAP